MLKTFSLLGVLLLLSCNPVVRNTSASATTPIYEIEVIENCEYIVVYTKTRYSPYGITHKGNCKNHSRSLYTNP